MRKFFISLLGVLILVSPLAFLSACSKPSSSIPPVSSAVSSAELSGPASEQATEIKTTTMEDVYRAVAEDGLLVEVIGYDAGVDMLYLRLGRPCTIEQFKAFLDIAEPFVVNEPFRINLGTVSSEHIELFALLAEMRFGSLELGLGTRDQKALDQLGFIPNLTSLYFTKADTNLTFPPMSDLRHLTIYLGRVGICFSGLEMSPQLEELVFISGQKPEFSFPNFTGITDLDSFADLFTLWDMPKLRSIEFKTATGQSLDELRGKTEDKKTYEKSAIVTMAVICDVARTIPTLQSLNGKDPASYDPIAGFTNEEKQLFEDYRASEFAKSVYAHMLEGNYAEGSTVISGPIIIWCATKEIPMEMISSPAVTAYGESYYGMPINLFTTDPRACSQVVLIYAVKEEAGKYSTSSGVVTGKGYITHTQVVVIDIASKTVSSPHITASEDPPATTTKNKDAGRFLPETALPYIQSLLP